jgi:CheY-like chemotaxis protein
VRLRRLGPILLADDDEATLVGLSEFLTELGYRVVSVRNGQEAMNLLVDGFKPSLLMIDLAMPHVGGAELLKYVQSDPELRLVPVLVVTGAPDRIGHAVADAIIAKPVNLAALLGDVQRLTTRRRPARH